MNEYKKPFVIAEIGCNHKGDIEIAKELIKIAKIFCNVDAVKFQKRNNKELLTEAQYDMPHPNPANSYGDWRAPDLHHFTFFADKKNITKAGQFCRSTRQQHAGP